MTEYQEAHRISQLLGAPQGYVGYGDGAQLPDRVLNLLELGPVAEREPERTLAEYIATLDGVLLVQDRLPATFSWIIAHPPGISLLNATQ